MGKLSIRQIFWGVLFLVLALSLIGVQPLRENRPIGNDQNTANYYLSIPKINVQAPIVPDVPGNDKEKYFSSLQNGVAHYLGTAKPGENSNIFIFGHSSFYLTDPGKYKEIFKNLDKLENGDELIVHWQNKEYKYKVTDKKIVGPNEIQYLDQTPFEQLTIMTCYPPGTIEKRLIIIAKP